MENKEKKKLTLKKVLKKVKMTHLLLLIVLLAVNSYAWFIYINTVSNSVDVHVKAWKIDFVDGETPVTDYVDVFVDNVYPGMTTFTKDIEAYNYSDVAADVSYKIIEADIMGDTILTVEGKQDKGLEVLEDDVTSDELIQSLLNEYPFSIAFSTSSDSMQAETGTATFTTQISWPYESGDDEADTLWGTRAFTFREDNPGEPCIRLVVKIYITQANS